MAGGGVRWFQVAQDGSRGLQMVSVAEYSGRLQVFPSDFRWLQMIADPGCQIATDGFRWLQVFPDVYILVDGMFAAILSYRGVIPIQEQVRCGRWLLMSLIPSIL